MYRSATVLILFCLSWINSSLVSMGYKPLPAVDEQGVANFIAFVMSIIALIHENPFKKLFSKKK